jgi:hypothetical protein
MRSTHARRVTCLVLTDAVMSTLVSDAVDELGAIKKASASTRC